MNYSIQKIRNLPIKQRINIVTCFTGEILYAEMFNMLVELGHEDKPNHYLINEVLTNLFKYYNDFNSTDIQKIIKLNHIDLLYFVRDIFCVHMCINYNLGMIISDIIYYNQNNKNIKEVVVLLEDFFIDIGNTYPSEQINNTTCFLLQSSLPFLNKLKLLDFLIKSCDSDFLIKYLKKYKQDYPPGSLIYQKINNILNIYDIIV